MIENVFPMHCYSHDYSLICLVARNKVWYEKWHYLKTPLTCTNMHRYALLPNKWHNLVTWRKWLFERKLVLFHLLYRSRLNHWIWVGYLLYIFMLYMITFSTLIPRLQLFKWFVFVNYIKKKINCLLPHDPFVRFIQPCIGVEI